MLGEDYITLQHEMHLYQHRNAPAAAPACNEVYTPLFDWLSRAFSCLEAGCLALEGQPAISPMATTDCIDYGPKLKVDLSKKPLRWDLVDERSPTSILAPTFPARQEREDYDVLQGAAL
jgi:hypothetical protein